MVFGRLPIPGSYCLKTQAKGYIPTSAIKGLKAVSQVMRGFSLNHRRVDPAEFHQLACGVRMRHTDGQFSGAMSQVSDGLQSGEGCRINGASISARSGVRHDCRPSATGAAERAASNQVRAAAQVEACGVAAKIHGSLVPPIRA